MNIVFLDADTIGKDISLAPLEALGGLKVFGKTLPNELTERIKNAGIIITNKVVLRQPEIDAATQLKLICITATGTNNIDTAYAAEKGIAVKNVANYSTESVVQTTFASLLALINHISYFDYYVKSGAYSTSSIFTHFGRTFSELAGKSFGVIGMGAIGERVAGVASAFGAKVSYYSTSGKHKHPHYPSLSLSELLHQSDVVSIHAPLNEKTNNLIDYAALQMMKPSAVLINMGRGGIVNEDALAKAIDQNLIAGAAIDVYAHEPLPDDHPYLCVNNKQKLILTPHVAWSSTEARARVVQFTAKNIEDFLASQP
ncbi:MAG: D-2-hydroxyacid dehydrogenase [Prevotellaceae bacterium]|jgi:glycerate dehydrogenase|nr:D-2-hydroxyacid dehydrogenase [Prevotellaceae bacterium]